MDQTAQFLAIAADDPISGTSIVQSIEESLIDEEITRMVVSGYQNIRIQHAAEAAA